MSVVPLALQLISSFLVLGIRVSILEVSFIEVRAQNVDVIRIFSSGHFCKNSKHSELHEACCQDGAEIKVEIVLL